MSDEVGANCTFPDARADIDWRRGTLVGAACGGLFWAFAASATIAGSGDRVASTLLTVGIVSGALLIPGAGLLRVNNGNARTVGLAVIVCAMSGWVIVASVFAQSLVGWA